MPKSIRRRFINPFIDPYWLGFIAIASLSFGLRFWQLSRFDSLVFDEVYFVKFARAYLTGTPQFDAHPPLGKYFIAAGIWLGDRISLTPPLSYRWMNALIGSCIPLVVMGIAHALSHSSEAGSKAAKAALAATSNQRHLTFVVLAGAFVATDGLFVTESRYALLNVYMVFFGLLGHWLWLQANLFSAPAQIDPIVRRTLCRVLAGISLGAAIATKWNGLGYIFSLLIWELLAGRRSPVKNKPNKNALTHSLLYLILIPTLTYCLIWLPHLYLTQESLASVHIDLFNFHRRLAAGGHPACSQWFTWPLLIKPIAYWYKESGPVAYTVSSLGNPALWWLSSASIFLLSLEKILRLSLRPSAAIRSVENNLGTYLLISYAANWLPWMLVGRCTFIYLYMPAAVFSFMTLAWLLSEWLYSFASSQQSQTISLIMLGAIALAFLFWLPLALGSPLTPEQLQARWWLKTWI